MLIRAILRVEMEAILRQPFPANTAVISINDPGQGSPLPPNMPDALIVEFFDLNSRIEGHEDEYPLFDEAQALQISAFVRRIAGMNLLVQCQGGQSRSGAVAVFAHELCGTDAQEFWQANPGITPNTHVLSLLRRLAGLPARSLPARAEKDVDLDDIF